jgi:putative ABC transport system permease protein
MSALAFAWRSLVRQPARATLGILGVAAVGALLFDMLLLSQGLVVSMRDLLDRTGWDVRVTATGDFPGRGPRLQEAHDAVRVIATLPSIRSVLALRFADARIDRDDGTSVLVSFQGVLGDAPLPWTIVAGRDAEAAGEVVVNDTIRRTLNLAPGGELTLRAACQSGSAVPPAVRLRVTGIAEFPFETTAENSVAGSFETLATACGDLNADRADVILVTSTGDPSAAASAVQSVRADLRAMTNEQMLGRFQESGFTYFRQISSVLTAITLSFALLLISVLLTVSVNQRLGEIAALRALGFSRRRVVADVFCESALIVGIGGLLSLPLGGALALWLDGILKAMPGIPVQMHFFVFEVGALRTHASLLVLTAFVAALYPMRIVARLPITATLRDEVAS